MSKDLTSTVIAREPKRPWQSLPRTTTPGKRDPSLHSGRHRCGHSDTDEVIPAPRVIPAKAGISRHTSSLVLRGRVSNPHRRWRGRLAREPAMRHPTVRQDSVAFLTSPRQSTGIRGRPGPSTATKHTILKIYSVVNPSRTIRIKKEKSPQYDEKTAKTPRAPRKNI